MNVLRHILTPHSVRNGKFWLREKVLDWIFFVWIVSGIFYCLRVEAYLWKVAKTRENFRGTRQKLDKNRPIDKMR